MKNLRHLFRRSGATTQRRRRPEKSRRNDPTQRRLSSEVLEKRELLAGDLLASDHNYWHATDVNDDGRISASDAIAVINRLGDFAAEAEQAGSDSQKMYPDVNADNNITAADALGVINAMSRGEEVGELVELLLTARDHVTDQELPVDGTGDHNVEVGQIFDLEVSYDDLRLFNSRLGVFQLFTDITVSQGGVLSPVLNETQRLIIDGTIQSVGSTSLTFSIPEAPPGIGGGALTYESSINDFGNNSNGEVINALTAFGYSTSQFDVSSLDFGNDDLGFQIHWTGDEFGNINLPNISVEVNETNPADDIPTQTIEFAPFLADGVTPNTDAVRFNINAFSRTFNNNEEFYSSQNRGEFDPATGFTSVGGLGQVPLEGGGIPQLTDDGGFIEPFDAFSLAVFLNQPVTDLVIGVNPGEDAEATLLYGRDDAVPQDMVLINPANANLTINAGDGIEPGTLVITPGAVSVNEDTGTVTLTVNRTGGSDGAVSVNFTTANGTAIAGSDYTANSGTLNFADGETNKTIVVAVINDDVEESNETFTVTLSNPTNGASLGTNVSTITILANDMAPEPGVFVINPAVSVNEDAGTASVRVDRTSGSEGAVSVAFTTADGSATSVQDYTATNGTLNFADGQTSMTITVPITDDALMEGNETFTVSLSNPGGGATLGSPTTSTVTIIDDEVPQPGVFTITPTASVNEDGGSVNLTVTRGSGNDGAVSVTYATSNGTATAGSDYTANSGTLNFADGETSKTITVAILDDTLDENNETFNVDLTNATNGATIGSPSSSTVTIVDDDDPIVPGVLAISPATLSVNEDGITATLTVSRTQGSDGAISVTFATANGSATAGSDYTNTNGTLSFADGETASKTISVPITNDTAVENPETFTVSLSNPAGGATLGASTSTVTIIDNDVDPDPVPGVLSISPGTISVNENTGTVSFTVSRSGGTDGVVSVNFATANGSAIAGSDYTANSGNLSFADGEASRSITVSIIDDAVNESNENFTVALSSPTGGASLGAVTVSTVTVLDNDPAGPGNATIAGSVFIDEVENVHAVVFEDAAPIRNGIKEGDDTGLGGITIHLAGEGVSRTAITDIDGGYSFDGLVGGTYEVTFHADPSTMLFVGSSHMSEVVPVGSNGLVGGVDFPLLGTQGSALNTVDILASSYLREAGPIAALSNGGVEGGLVSLHSSGDQNFFIAGKGFDGVSFLELNLNADRDEALLTIIEEGVAKSARLSEDHFVVTSDGTGVQFFGGRDDFAFSEDGFGDFPNRGNAVDKVFAQN